MSTETGLPHTSHELTDVPSREFDDEEVPDQADVEEAAEDSDPDDPSALSNDVTNQKRKEKAEVFREPGKSLLPASRVLKIIKADEVC
jgi:hypothetical protein